MSSSILLNCKENVSDHLSFDVMYMAWLTSPTPSHLNKIIANSPDNYLGTLKKKKKSKQIIGAVTWFSFAHQYLSWESGTCHQLWRGQCLVRCDWFPATFHWVGALLVLQFLSLYTSPFKVADFLFLLWFFLVSHTKVAYSCCQCSVLSAKSIKSLSHFRKSDCTSLFLMTINRDLREAR